VHDHFPSANRGVSGMAGAEGNVKTAKKATGTEQSSFLETVLTRDR
jgi:hypothetical protein